MSTISSRSHPIVRRFRAIAAGRSSAAGHLLIEGARLLADALASGLPLVQAAASAQFLDRDDAEAAALLDRLRARGTPVARVTAPVLAALSPARAPSGIVAIAERPAGDLERALAGSFPLVVTLVDVQDPGNVGAAIRATEAGGGTGVVVAGASADPFGWKALRGAMGSALRLPVAIVKDAGQAAGAARARGLQIVATAPRGGRSIFEAGLVPPALLLIGGEGAGLDPRLVAAADSTVTIPMQPPVESLNVAVTAALAVYTLAQRAAKRVSP